VVSLLRRLSALLKDLIGKARRDRDRVGQRDREIHEHANTDLAWQRRNQGRNRHFTTKIAKSTKFENLKYINASCPSCASPSTVKPSDNVEL